MYIVLANNLLLNIGGTEWMFIIFIVLFLLFGTKKVPEVFKTIGKISSEFDNTKRMISDNIEYNTPIKENKIPKITGPIQSEREKLETIASSLGIDTLNLRDSELRDIISRKMREF